MSSTSFDPELMQDFLTESGELLEQLDQDLIRLESAPQDPELLNQVFRALHTIKGSASFLALTNLVGIAHAAEGALNAARNRVITVDRTMMDGLLAAVDLLKRQFQNIRDGEELVAAEPALIASLTAYADGRAGTGSGTSMASAAGDVGSAQVDGQAQVGRGGPGTPTGAAGASAPTGPTSAPAGKSEAASKSGAQSDSKSAGEFTEQPLKLPPGKDELLEFLVADVNATLDQVEAGVRALAGESGTGVDTAQLAEQCAQLARSVDFFDFNSMTKVVDGLCQFAKRAANLSGSELAAATSPAKEAVERLRRQSSGLSERKLLTSSPDELVAKLVGADTTLVGGAGNAATLGVSAASGAMGTGLGGPAAQPGAEPAPGAPRPTPNEPADSAKGGEHKTSKDGGDQTIRVEVSRLESLLNLVGELVLQKNRVSALARGIAALEQAPSQESREAFTQASGTLDRVTSELQAAVMRTRMQPLDKIFGKYPRVIRDLARKLNKQINLVIEGGETEVDKSVIEELGDPLVHLIRNSADHGIEPPEQRRSANKPEAGTIRLKACHRGSHVQILISDDGRGLNREKISQKAIEKGLYTAEQIDAMSEKEVLRIIFAAGFSTAEKISDVSGRGVGMDVVRTNIEKLKGTIELSSVPGQGTTVEILIPLTVAIMSAMMVEVGGEIYAVPLTNIVEIVRPEPAQLASITQNPVLRLRDRVLPLLSAGELFSVPLEKRGKAPFAVVIELSDRTVGLLVDRLIGQQEIVIKPLSELLDKGGPVSGATVRDDGGVSLIVDIARLFQLADARAGRS